MWKELSSSPHLPLVLFSTVCIPIKGCCVLTSGLNLTRTRHLIYCEKNHSKGAISMSSSCMSCVHRIVRYRLHALLLQLAPNNFVLASLPAAVVPTWSVRLPSPRARISSIVKGSSTRIRGTTHRRATPVRSHQQTMKLGPLPTLAFLQVAIPEDPPTACAKIQVSCLRCPLYAHLYGENSLWNPLEQY
ncbi:hypothetical protein EDD17DRAFT_106039 [Pisolithus thermaeus]|nr:hypothetical protein EV401DRAFT_1107259 [Pisolithus croceorrhizus]KAI6165866.1 hypothetical protein EDD17DRAFT_106039 [Pisolithus thermaeus]